MKTITYTIETVQPVKVGSQASQTDVQHAPDFLPGTSIRGALLAVYARKMGLDLDTNVTERRRWLNGDTRFLHAYPERNGARTIPMPCHLYAQKPLMKLFDSGSSMELPVNNVFENRLEDNDKRVSYGGFVEFGSDGRLVHHTVRKKFHLHVSLKERVYQLFRFETIEPNQTFQGMVVNADDALVQFLSTMQGQPLFIGGSRTSGYGHCIIREVTCWDQAIDTVSPAGNKMYIYAVSDWLLRDEFGRPATDLTAERAAKLIGSEDLVLRASQSAVQTASIGGYIDKWRSPMPIVTGVQRGSIFAYEIVQGTVDPAKVHRLLLRGIGDRRVEGYGEIMVRSAADLTVSSIIRIRSQTSPSATFEGSPALTMQKNEDDRMRLARILKRGQQVLLQGKREEGVLVLWGKTVIGKQVNNSQISKLIDLINAALYKVELHGESAIENTRQDVLDYFRHLTVRRDGAERSNQRAREQLERFKVDHKTIIDFMINFIQGADEPIFDQYFGTGHDGSLTKDEKYIQSLWLLQHYLRFVRRNRKHQDVRDGVGTI
ncbi:RAMP superfamily CRISPR-associated protein [Paenibacillus chartarius]|uniref:RAMP superfamily CRISPR-associated protein n=1 Tax=Paenibacillus chartarius TaxID=747481 RepID=A0ABV6DTJ4_9BACL